MQLTSSRVESIFIDCLFNEGEDTGNHIDAYGVKLMVGFNPVMIEKHKPEIEAMLKELPDEFKQTIGGGSSFLVACLNNKDEQWADSHTSIDQLLCLGIATQLVDFNAPRNLWRSLPGGMPYFFLKF